MKKIISILLLSLVFVLVGCTSATTITNSTTKVITTKEKTTTITNIITTTKEMTTKENTTTKMLLEGSPIAVGIWHRPNVLGTENDLDGIKNTLDIFKRCGINIVYLETIYHGMAMYKSNLLPYYSGFSGNKYGDYKLPSR